MRHTWLQIGDVRGKLKKHNHREMRWCPWDTLSSYKRGMLPRLVYFTPLPLVWNYGKIYSQLLNHTLLFALITIPHWKCPRSSSSQEAFLRWRKNSWCQHRVRIFAIQWLFDWRISSSGWLVLGTVTLLEGGRCILTIKCRALDYSITVW